MRYQKTNFLTYALRVALVLLAACAFTLSSRADAAASARPAATAVRASVSGPATYIVIEGTAPMAYTVRRPAAQRLVVDLHNVDASALASAYAVESPLVSRVAVKLPSATKEISPRVEIALRAPARERSHMSNTGLVVELLPDVVIEAAQFGVNAQAEFVKASAVSATHNDTAQQSAAGQTVGSAPQSQGQRYGQPGFVGEPISLNVVNADVRDILNYITEQYGVNFIIDSSVGKIPVTVNVTDVPWNIALDSILKANRLGVEANGNILRVATTKVLAEEAAVQATIREAALENSPLITEYVRLNYARASGTLQDASGSTGNFSGGNTGTSFSGGSGGGAQADSGVLPIIKRRLSKRGAIEFDGRSNTLIITDVRENIDAIRQLILLLDQPEPQVEIETRIVVASRNFSRDLGVQLQGAVFGARGQGGEFSTATVSTPGLNPGGLPGGLLNTPPPAGSLGATAPNTVIGLTTGIFGTAQIGALITAAETKGQAKVIATPRVTALNNRPAQIESGSQIPVVTPQTGGGGSNSTLFTTTFVSVPLRLSVTPQITDAGTVILRVVAENNSVNLSLTNSLGTPGIDTQRMQTEVLVPDGGTTVVGGVLNDREAETQNRTPGLSGIPVIGNLFKRRATVRSTDEILFFITPRIYRPDYQGRRTEAGPTVGTKFVSIPQPVAPGNPDTNTPTPQGQEIVPQQQPIIVPIPTGTTTLPQAPPPVESRP